VLLWVLACGGDKGGATGSTGETGAPTTSVDEAALLADLVVELANYQTWGQAPGWEGLVATPGGNHGPAVEIYYDDTALADLADPAIGSTAFKRAYADPSGATLASIAAMRNVEGYGWFYVDFAADGTVNDSGRLDLCVGCHESLGANGFLVDN
jgi:hypothetical protein